MAAWDRATTAALLAGARRRAAGRAPSVAACAGPPRVLLA